ncbi:hypothetical protein VTL71DRAFT_14294, partial [Oculimacula yallundae]
MGSPTIPKVQGPVCVRLGRIKQDAMQMTVPGFPICRTRSGELTAKALPHASTTQDLQALRRVSVRETRGLLEPREVRSGSGSGSGSRMHVNQQSFAVARLGYSSSQLLQESLTDSTISHPIA